MIVKPFSALDSSTELAPTVANFPGLVHFFDFGAIPTGSGTFATIADAIGTMVLGNVAGQDVTNNGDGTITFAINLSRQGGAWASPGAKNVLAIYVGALNTTTANISVGSIATSANFGFRFSGTTANVPTIANGTVLTTAASNAAVAVSNPCSRILAIDWGTNFVLYGSDIATAPGAAVTTATAAAGLTFGAADSQIAAMQSGTNPALLAIFHLTTLPSAAVLNAACTWMADRAVNRALYPALADYT